MVAVQKKEPRLWRNEPALWIDKWGEEKEDVTGTNQDGPNGNGGYVDTIHSQTETHFQTRTISAAVGCTGRGMRWCFQMRFHIPLVSPGKHGRGRTIQGSGWRKGAAGVWREWACGKNQNGLTSGILMLLAS
jgi:hypothetical protein